MDVAILKAALFALCLLLLGCMRCLSRREQVVILPQSSSFFKLLTRVLKIYERTDYHTLRFSFSCTSASVPA
jgi:hypothetical protein